MNKCADKDLFFCKKLNAFMFWKIQKRFVLMRTKKGGFDPRNLDTFFLFYLPHEAFWNVDICDRSPHSEVCESTSQSNMFLCFCIWSCHMKPILKGKKSRIRNFWQRFSKVYQMKHKSNQIKKHQRRKIPFKFNSKWRSWNLF